MAAEISHALNTPELMADLELTHTTRLYKVARGNAGVYAPSQCFGSGSGTGSGFKGSSGSG